MLDSANTSTSVYSGDWNCMARLARVVANSISASAPKVPPPKDANAASASARPACPRRAMG